MPAWLRASLPNSTLNSSSKAAVHHHHIEAGVIDAQQRRRPLHDFHGRGRHAAEVDLAAARRNAAAIDRIESPATMPREISSRSDRLKANVDRCRRAGRMPPVANK